MAMKVGHRQSQTHEEVRTLWIGDLPYWINENHLKSWFSHIREFVSVKLIRNKITKRSEGYGFIEFGSHEAAERTLQKYAGKKMPGTESYFRLNWASYGSRQKVDAEPESNLRLNWVSSGSSKKVDAEPDHSIFVENLAPEVTDYLLQETFRILYPSVRGANVVIDSSTGRSEGYGFVKFADESERNRAMAEMNGVFCSWKPMRISAAAPEKTVGVPQPYVPKAVYQAYVAQPGQVPPRITVTNLDPNVTEAELKKAFSQLGEIIYVDIPVIKGYGYVQFKTRLSAQEAFLKMQGKMIGQKAVHISWSRDPGQDGSVAQADPNQWSGHYGYGQGYNAYAYGATQDPSLDAYGGYGYPQYPLQDGWPAQANPNQWSGNYGYGQGYDAYAYGTTKDPSLYAYGGYGYPQYPQQGEGTSSAAADQELYDPMATPDVDELNADIDKKKKRRLNADH